MSARSRARVAVRRASFARSFARSLALLRIVRRLSLFAVAFAVAASPRTTESHARRSRAGVARAMDTVRRVLGAYLSAPIGEIASGSPASSVKSLAPRRLSFARASSTSASDGVARAMRGNQATRAMSRFVRDAVGGKRARESSGTNGEGATSEGGGGDVDVAGGKRPRRDDDVDVAVVRGEISGRDDEDLAPWPSAKRKRAMEDDDDAETPAAHRRRTSERASVRAPRARATPVLVAEKVLKGGRLDGFKALPKMPSRVAAPARRGPTNRRGLGGRRRVVDVRARVEFDELAEDKAERERLEAARAPALGVPSSSTTTVASDRPKSSDSGGLGAALAEFKPFHDDRRRRARETVDDVEPTVIDRWFHLHRRTTVIERESVLQAPHRRRVRAERDAVRVLRRRRRRRRPRARSPRRSRPSPREQK